MIISLENQIHSISIEGQRVGQVGTAIRKNEDINKKKEIKEQNKLEEYSTS